MPKKRTRKPGVNIPPARQEATISLSNDTPEANNFLQKWYGSDPKALIVVVIILGCVAIYSQSYYFEFINFDDNYYIYKNPFIVTGLNWETVKWAFTTYHAANWHPLTWMSHLADVSFFGITSGFPHLENMLLHIVNSVLVFFVVREITGANWRSGIVALIFAFHPAHVESVAWVAERKDLLSSLFGLASIWAYLKFARSSNRKYYFVAFGLLAIGLLAKPMLVTIPFVYLLLDVWPLRRINLSSLKSVAAAIPEKLPFFALSAASCIVTVIAQKAGGAVMPLEKVSIASRVQNALLAVLSYLKMFFLPLWQGAWYPFPDVFPLWKVILSAAIIITVTIVGIRLSKSHGYIFTGWLWFLGMLVPVIGLVQVGGQAYADRYTYLPFIGLSIAVIWSLSALFEKYRFSGDVVATCTVIIIVAFAVLSYRQAATWQNNETFYTHTLAVTERAYLLEQNYCDYLLQKKQVDLAEYHCRRSIEENPNHSNAYISLGVIEMAKGDNEAGLRDFETAYRLEPNDLQARSNYINGLIATGRLDEAKREIGAVQTLDIPSDEMKSFTFPLVRLMGFAFGQAGRVDESVEYLMAAESINDKDPNLLADLGGALIKAGRAGEAIQFLQKSDQLKPDQPLVLDALGHASLAAARLDEAASYFKAALKIDPNLQSSIDGLAAAKKDKTLKGK